MKKFLLTVCFFIVIGNTVQAQLLRNMRNEFDIGYGFGSSNELINSFDAITVSVFGDLEQIDETYWGTVYLTYKHNISYKTRLGVTFGADFESGNYRNNLKQIVGSYDLTTYTIAGEAVYNYVTSTNTTVYGALGIGYSFSTPKNSFNSSEVVVQSDSYDHFNFQVTPVGVKYGSAVGGFFELGFGYKGIVSGGMYFKFK